MVCVKRGRTKQKRKIQRMKQKENSRHWCGYYTELIGKRENSVLVRWMQEGVAPSYISRNNLTTGGPFTPPRWFSNLKQVANKKYGGITEGLPPRVRERLEKERRTRKVVVRKVEVVRKVPVRARGVPKVKVPKVKVPKVTEEELYELAMKQLRERVSNVATNGAEETSETEECVICFGGAGDPLVLEPCGHQAIICSECRVVYVKGMAKICPVCREPLDSGV